MIKTSKISFCGKQACNIIEDSFKEELFKILSKYCISIKDKNFYIINSKNVKYIEKNPHFLSVKSSGSLYYLFFTNIEGSNYCFFIDKKIKDGHKFPRIISVNYRFDDAIFEDTLFDGELLRDKDNNWLYIINNLVLYKKILMKDRHINQKIDIIYDILSNKYIRDDNLEICPLFVKRLFSNHELEYMIKTYIPSLNYNCRGLYFEGIRNLKNHLFLFPKNTNFENVKNVKKSKEIKKNVDREFTNIDLSNISTINFMVKKTETSDIYNLYIMNDNDLVKYGNALIPNLKTSKLIRKIFSDGNDNITFKCEYNKSMQKWKPLEISKEKIDDIKLVEGILILN
mgnify:CR=1 FL=1|tara:strand:+ start:3506 stop:4531 length:1026 start_codon:yes stop_codon:yes gene_type:complete